MKKESQFSLNARRTTRVAVRTAVQVDILDPDGTGKTMSAWTQVVNKHGARLVGKQPLEMNAAVRISVPATGKSARGRVIWIESRPSPEGNFDFAVELEKPDNLWGITFPPSDWELQEVVVETEPAERTANATADPVAGSDPPATQEYGVCLDPIQLPRIESGPQLFDFTEEVSKLSPGFQASGGRGNLPLENSSEVPIATAACNFAPQHLSRAMEEELPNAEPVRLQSEMAAANRGTGVPPASSPTYVPNRTAWQPAGPESVTDRLSEILNEVVGSALQAKVEAALGWLDREMESRIAQAQERASTQLLQQMQVLVSSQNTLLEGQAAARLTSQQQQLEETFRQFEEAGVNSLQLLRQKAADAVSSSLSSLQQEMAGQVQAREQQFAEMCRMQTEELVTLHQEHAGRAQALLERAHLAAGEAGRLTEHAEGLAAQFSEELQRRSADLLTDTMDHLKAQLTETSSAIQRSFLLHMVKELQEKQTEALEQIQSQIGESVEQSVLRLRTDLADLFRQLSGAMAMKTTDKEYLPQPASWQEEQASALH